MKKLYLSVITLMGMVAYGQEVIWQRNIKSDTQEFLSQLTITIDGQILLSGSSIQTHQESVTTIRQNQGYDYHVLKMNQQGQKVWEKYLGGSNHDFLTATASTQEGGFLLVGTSFSDAGLQKNNKLKGGSDIWIVKLDENGEEQWQRTLGTRHDEEAKSVIQATDLSYFVAGNVQGKKEAFGSKDVLVVKLDKNGKIINQIYFGGEGLDEVERIIPTRDGGALVGIYSRSSSTQNAKVRIEIGSGLDDDFTDDQNAVSTESDPTVSKPSSSTIHKTKADPNNNAAKQITTTYYAKTTENYGEGDFWVVKLSKDCQIEWEQNFGGKDDDHLRALANTDTGFVIAGESRSSISGNKKSTVKEGTDVWVITLNELGEEQWQKGYNFQNRDVLMSLNTINDATGNQTRGFLVGGYTQYEGKTQKDDETFWMLYIDNKGEEVWKKYVEGEEKKQHERLADAKLNKDGTYLIAGTSGEELGRENWKIVKLGDQQIEELMEKQDIRIYPNPVQDYAYVEIGRDFKVATISIYDMSGKLAYQTQTQSTITKLNTKSLVQGSYIISASTEKNKFTAKIIKK